MIQIAVSPFYVRSVFITADKTIQCMFVRVIFTAVANSQVVECVTVLKGADEGYLLNKTIWQFPIY